MSAQAMDATMARRNDVTVKMDAEVARKAKIVAAYRDQSLAEFISDQLSPIVDRMLQEEHAKETGSKPGRTKGGK